MRTPADPHSEIKGMIYVIEGIAPGFLRDRRPRVDLSTVGDDEAGTLGGGDTGETGTWRTVDDDGRFPSLVDVFLHHGGSLETIQELIRGIKACTEEEMENWGPGRIRLQASTCPEEPNIMMDDWKEVEKWEHLEELRLWMKHVVGLMSDIVNNGLGHAYFVSPFGPLLFGNFLSHIVIVRLLAAGSERDLPPKVGFYSCDERRLGAAPSSQGATPRVVGKASQGVQGPYGGCGEEREGGCPGQGS
jgi:hypothetical protein